jgi:hypothetical protein
MLRLSPVERLSAFRSAKFAPPFSPYSLSSPYLLIANHPLDSHSEKLLNQLDRFQNQADKATSI